jgi:hypothetical protein
MLHLKLLEEQKQAKPQTTRQREIIKIGVEINEIKKKTIQRINETKSCFFDKIDKLLASMTKCRKKKTQINKIKDEKEDITKNTNKIKNH